jgi:hypothetical protein
MCQSSTGLADPRAVKLNLTHCGSQMKSRMLAQGKFGAADLPWECVLQIHLSPVGTARNRLNE